MPGVRRPSRRFLAAILTEIYRCNVCSCQEILRRNGHDQLVELAPVRSCLDGMGLTNIDDAYVLEESDKAKLRDIVRRCRPAVAPATARHGAGRPCPAHDCAISLRSAARGSHIS
jgi:hypothetical protein